MSTKLTVTLQNSKKICDQISEQELLLAKLKRVNILDKQHRSLATQKMKSKLQEVAELSNKYVDLQEFKKSSCINIDLYVPILKLDEDDEGLSETQLD